MRFSPHGRSLAPAVSPVAARKKGPVGAVSCAETADGGGGLSPVAYLPEGTERSDQKTARRAMSSWFFNEIGRSNEGIIEQLELFFMSNRQQRQKRIRGLPLRTVVKDFRVSPLDNYPKEQALKMGYDALRGHRERRKDIDRMEREWVEELRRIGSTWSEIAEAMGVSRQAVGKRFAAKPRGRE